jgi:hypothetical protein
MGQINSIVLGLSFFVLISGLYFIYTYVLRPTHLGIVPGPRNSHWFFGHAREIYAAEQSLVLEQWLQEYGHVMQYSEIMNVRRDPRLPG